MGAGLRSGSEPSKAAVREELSDELFPPGASAFCSGRSSANTDKHCLLASLRDAGTMLRLWPFGLMPDGEAGATLKLQQAWHVIAGAIVHCNEKLIDSKHSDGWCLFLIGGDGGERLHVAFVPLPNGPWHPPSESTHVRPRFGIPLHDAESDLAGLAEPSNVRALYLESTDLRLWAVLASG